MGPRHSQALDGIRWFAFLGVFLYHSQADIFHFGAYGVQVFFVLSGFLIGDILLGLRRQVEIPWWERLTIFYIRRSLRILPLYYFVLLAIFALFELHILDDSRMNLLPVHAFYLTNLYLALTGAQIDSQTHFWSLCVEEHFYLLAPILLLLVSARKLEIAFVIMLISVTLARLFNFLTLESETFLYLSPMQFDMLGIGVAAALVARRGSVLGVSERRFTQAGKLCGLGALAIALWAFFPSAPQRFAEAVLLPPLLATAAAAFILSIWKGLDTPIVHSLNSRPFVYLGKISYGLYVYHNFLFVIARDSSGGARALLLFVSLAATIAIASASWHLLERPINDFKRRFPYDRTVQSPALAMAAMEAAPERSAQRA